jgi:hypothetical protein
MAAIRLVLCAAMLCGMGARPALAEPRPSGLPAVISLGSSGFDPASVRGAVEHELGVPLRLDANAEERLEIVVTGRRANVTYYARDREPVTRSVDLPNDSERALATLAFLAGNLARDEASELLRELSPPAADATSETVPPPPVPPPPAPALPPPPSKAATGTGEKPSATPLGAPAEKLIDPGHFMMNASLWHPVSAVSDSERYRLNLELGLAYSRDGAIRGAALSFGYLRVDQDLHGFAAALGWTRTGEMRGVSLGLFGVESSGIHAGFSAGMLANLHDGSVTGAQTSLVYASAEELRGFQGSVLVAHARDVQGAQATSGASIARNVEGAQLGLVAVARDVRGAQPGLVTVAHDVTGAQASLVAVAHDLEGVQVSLVNVAHRAFGLQVGLVNVSDEIHGGALGLVNIAKNGRFQPAVWATGPKITLMAGYKSVTDYTYALGGVGYDPIDQNFRVDFSTGLHLAFAPGWFGELGIGYDNTRDISGGEELRHEVRLDGRLGFEPVHGVTPFVGGSVTRRIEGQGADYTGQYAVGISFL